MDKDMLKIIKIQIKEQIESSLFISNRIIPLSVDLSGTISNNIVLLEDVLSPLSYGGVYDYDDYVTNCCGLCPCCCCLCGIDEEEEDEV